MLTHNLDTPDCLTNGSFGNVIGFEHLGDGSISHVIVQFYDEECGKERRKNNVRLKKKYPNMNATPIEMMEFHYAPSKKQATSVRSCTATQFPLRLAFAATAHKVQGQTVKKPNSLAIDLRSVRESAQAYVMLSRVQCLNQVFIIDCLPADKIYRKTCIFDQF